MPKHLELTLKSGATLGRALGMADLVLVDLARESLQPGDRYVLCSDGLSGMVTDEEIRDAVLANPDPEAACAALVALANAHGGEDNVTAIVVRIADASEPEPPSPGDSTPPPGAPAG